MNAARSLRSTLSTIRRAARFSLWRTISTARSGPLTRIPVYGRHSIYVRTDDYRGFRVAELGGSQSEKIDVWRVLTSAHPDLVIDAGANYGEFSVVAADAGLDVLAIEPNPVAADCLRRTFANMPNVTVIESAVSDTEGETRLFRDPRASGSGSLAQRVTEGAQRTAIRRRIESIRVKVCTLDTLVLDQLHRAPKTLLFKIDVEGLEPSVLRGAARLLQQASRWWALIEFQAAATERAGNSAQEFWHMLRQFGGHVISAGMPADQVLRVNGHLPDQYPDECDVVIGGGELWRACQKEFDDGR